MTPRRPRRRTVVERKGHARAPGPFREVSSARGVRTPADVFLDGLAQAVPFERVSFFFYEHPAAVAPREGDLRWAATFRRGAAAPEEPVGLSPKLLAWVLSDRRPKIVPRSTLAPASEPGEARVYLFLPLAAFEERVGLAIVRAQVSEEAVGAAQVAAIEGLAAWLGERLAYAAAYLVAEVERRHLASSARFAESVLDAIGEGLVALDADGRVRMLNRNARLMLGAYEPEVPGRPLERVVAPELAELLARLRAAAIATGRAGPEEAALKLGVHPLPVEITAVRVEGRPRSAPGEANEGVLLVLRNLAVSKRLAKLEEMDRLKSEFLSTVSHELRSPLTSLRGAVDLMTDGTLGSFTEAQGKMIDILKHNTDWLCRLIEDLLDMSRLETGRLRLEKLPVEIDTLAEAVAVRFRLDAEKKGLAFRTALDSGARVEADLERIEQVLVNLLSNALKFTQEGEVCLATARAGEGEVEVSVSDTGVGIAPEDLPLVFDKFEQVGRRASTRKGSGLGLAISRELVLLHGGGLAAESEPGAGSRFHFRLPILKEGGA